MRHQNTVLTGTTPDHNPNNVEYMSGFGAAALSVLVTYPINKLMFRQSLWGFDVPTAWRQLKIEGIQYLYRGALPPVIIKSLTSCVMFGTFHQYRNYIASNPRLATYLGDRPVALTFVAANLSGASEALLTPFERVQMLLQDGRYNNEYSNTVNAFWKIRRYGLTEYYRGLSAVLLRNGPCSFLYFYCQPRIKDFFWPDLPGVEYTSREEMVQNFFSGAVLGAAISTIFYPLQVVKVHMQVQPVGTDHLTIRETISQLYNQREGNTRLLLAGIHTNLARSFIYWGCITCFSAAIRETIIEHP